MCRCLLVGICFAFLGSSTLAQPPAPSAAAGEKQAAAADAASYLRDVSTALKARWPRNRIVNIVCHGHSVPAGYFKTPVVETFNAYPHLLHVGLKERFPFAVANVIVTAIGGENAEGGAARFDRDVLALRPDVVTIDYALNDRPMGLERARTAWVSMIEKAQAARVKVILLTPTADFRAKLDDPNDPLCQHAKQVRELAAKYHVGLVDSLADVQQHLKGGGKLEDLMSQVNHPNRKGHELVAKRLLAWFPK
jgi:acyl-CoA thioesterase I